MSLRPVLVVYRKEIRDLRRDWRTIIGMVVVPVIIVPLVMYGVFKIARTTMKQESKVMLLGGEDSPETVADLRRLSRFDLVPDSLDYSNLISTKKISAAVEIPVDFEAAVVAGRKPEIRIYTYDGEPKSMQAAGQLEEFFRHRREELVRRRLAESHLPESLVAPFEIARRNVASPRQVTGVVVGMIVPYIMIVMCLAGAIHPAVDSTAGEKERGTMETLLTSPVGRTHLVAGKGLVVLTASLATAALSMCSNGLVLVFLRNDSFAKMPLALDPLALAGVCVLMIPLAVFLSSLTIMVGLFARSAREANTYLQPMLLLAVVPALLAALPGMEFNYRLAFIPVLNLSLLSKELLTGACHWGHVLAVFGSMTIYAAAAVAAAVSLFKRETVLFRS